MRRRPSTMSRYCRAPPPTRFNGRIHGVCFLQANGVFMSLGQRVIQQDALYLDQTKCTFSFFYRQNEVCVSCESLTLFMNLHSFVWEKKTYTRFWPVTASTCPSVPVFNVLRKWRTSSWPSCRHTCWAVKPLPRDPNRTVTFHTTFYPPNIFE